MVPRKRSTSWPPCLHLGFDEPTIFQAESSGKLTTTCPGHFLLDESITLLFGMQVSHIFQLSVAKVLDSFLISFVFGSIQLLPSAAVIFFSRMYLATSLVPTVPQLHFKAIRKNCGPRRPRIYLRT